MIILVVVREKGRSQFMSLCNLNVVATLDWIFPTSSGY